MKIIDNTPIENFDTDWGDPDGTGMKEKSKEQVQKFIKKKFIGLGYTFLGKATPSTVPATITIEDKFLYIATEEGDYANYGLGTISELSAIKSLNGSWVVESLSFFQKEIKSEDVRLSEFLLPMTTIKPDGSVQSSSASYKVYKFQNNGYVKLQGVASSYTNNYLIALYSDESCSSDSFIRGVKATSPYTEQSYSLEVPSNCKSIVISQYSSVGPSTCTAFTYLRCSKLDALEDKLTELDNIVSSHSTTDILPFKKTQGVYFKSASAGVSLESSNTCAVWEYKIDNISSERIQVNISQSTLAGSSGLGPSGVIAGLFSSNNSENPSDYTCISVLQLGDAAIFDYELNVPLVRSADLLCVSFRQNSNEDSKVSVAVNNLSLVERVEILENNTNGADAFEEPNYDGVAVVSNGNSILGFGASFMRGNATGAGSNNSWLHILADSLGCTAINDALGGSNIMYHANRLFNSQIYTDSQVDNIDAIVIMHAHDKDVFTLPSEFVNYSVEDYESNVLPFATTTGAAENDVVYAKAFDYVIKKIFSINFSHKYDTLYMDSMAQYVGTNYFKPTQILLVTHWHDQREVYNKSVRKLASKWGFPLIQLDKKIGFTKNNNNPAFKNQPSLEFVGNIGGASPVEKISGVAYGWHPMCGNNEVFIQRKIAAICKQSFMSI